jgi:RNA polymerase sigma-70 factor (ECF subfamily)
LITKTEILDEEAIIRQSVTDPESFRPLYEKYFKKIFLFLYHRLGDKETAADIAQQVFLKALRGLSKFQHKGLPFSAWLYRIAINECNQLFRKSKQIRIVTLDDADVSHLFEELTTDQTLENLHQKLPGILQKLTADELYLIELRYFESKPFAEVGAILEITETHAKVKTYRVIEKMKKLFLL